MQEELPFRGETEPLLQTIPAIIPLEGHFEPGGQGWQAAAPLNEL
jgi:hypothetical protein